LQANNSFITLKNNEKNKKNLVPSRQFHVLLTLFSKSFSPFLHSTSLLLVSRHIFSFGSNLTTLFELQYQTTLLIEDFLSINTTKLIYKNFAFYVKPIRVGYFIILSYTTKSIFFKLQFNKPIKGYRF
jgi:hypothetical protein